MSEGGGAVGRRRSDGGGVVGSGSSDGDRVIGPDQTVDDGGAGSGGTGHAAGGPSSNGRILLAGTPIGDVDDAPARLVRLLADADVIAAEDTRRLRALAARLQVSLTARVVSYHEHNETERAAELVEYAQAGATVLVVSDAGMPGVSDPGYRVVAAAAAAGVQVSAIPGPSAALTALALSGLPSDRFTFEGFPARKAGERDRALGALAGEQRTMVFFESPHRIGATLAAMARAFGPGRQGAVCRELTKTYEEVRRGPLADLADWAAHGLRGEISIVIAGATPQTADPAQYAEEVLARAAAGQRLKEAAAAVSAETGASKRELYEAALSRRTRADQPRG